MRRAARARPAWRSWRRTAVLAALLAAVLGVIAVRALAPEAGGSAQMLAPGALRVISPHLASAYRDGFGYGPRFFGTLSESWDAQAPDRRRAAALALGARLQRFGVVEALLFDARRQLRVHYRDGALLVPAAPAGAPESD